MVLERLNLDQIVPFKEVSLFEPYETKLEEAWQVFKRYRSEMPFSPDVHRVSNTHVSSSLTKINYSFPLKEIYLTKDIKHVKFEELNFFHSKCFCTNDYIKASWEFLKSENARELRKLSIKSCVLQRARPPKANNTLRFSRDYPIEDIIKNCPNVSTLELMHCPRYVVVLDWC